MKLLVAKKSPEAIGPYTQMREANGLCFFSGQIALDPESGEMVQNNFAAEVHQVMRNVANLLRDNDLDFKDLLKVNISLTDMSNFAILNDIYASYVVEPHPARACVGVISLPKNANVEIEVIAYRQ